MQKFLSSVVLAMAFALAISANVQAAVEPNSNHVAMLASSDSHLAANKLLVYDFWREVLEAGHMELTDKYMTEDYIQHNPNLPNGRAAFVTYFSPMAKPKPIESRVKTPLVAIIAEGDLVIVTFVQATPDLTDPKKTYTSTWFDMFRIEGGKIVEHWDASTRQ